MATFNLTWNSGAVAANPNSTGQRVEYRRKIPTGSSFINNININPVNDLSTSATSASVLSLLTNIIYEFRVLAICNGNATTPNDNGIRESIKFACPTTTETHTDTSITVSVVGLPVDITKVIFNRGAGNVAILTSGGGATTTFSGLTPGTLYTITTEIAAIVNGAEITSTLGCSIAVTTNAAATCSAPTGLTVTPAVS